MKFYKNQFNNLMELIINGEIKAILLYGPDKGEISDLIINIAKQLSIPVSQVEYKDVNNKYLYNIANSSSLFSKKELIKIQNVTSSITEDAIECLSRNLQNFLVFIGDELAPSSSVRKTFESNKFLAALPCYLNDLRESILIAKSEFNKYKKNIGNKALELFCRTVGGVKNTIKNEVQKLSNYTESDIITEDDIFAVSTYEFEVAPDLMCYNYVIDNKNICFQEIEKLLNESIDPVWIVRALVRYLLNILKVKKSNLPIDVAIKTLTPPIFFKQILNFKQAAVKVDFEYIRINLEKLARAEIDLKSGVCKDSVINQLLLI